MARQEQPRSLLIAPLMELKMFIPFSVAFITNSFNRTAYGIEKSVYVSPEKSIPTAFNRTAYGIENDE